MPLVRIAFRAGPVAPEDWSFGDGKAQYLKTD